MPAWGELQSSRTSKQIEVSQLPGQVKAQLLEAQELLKAVRAEFPRLHPVVTHYQKGAMAPQERRYRYLIARSFGLSCECSSRIRDFREHTFFRWLTEVLQGEK